MAEIGVGFHAFASDRVEEIGAVRRISRDGRHLTLYVENAGEFEVPAEAVDKVGHQKVTLDVMKVGEDLREAIAHAHDAEIGNDDELESS